MNTQEIASLLKELSVLFPNQFEFPTTDEEKDKIAIKVWKDKIGDFEKDFVLKAVNKIGADNPDFIPSPFRVREEAKNLKRKIERQKEEKRQEQFLEEQEKIAEKNIKQAEEEFDIDSLDYKKLKGGEND